VFAERQPNFQTETAVMVLRNMKVFAPGGMAMRGERLEQSPAVPRFPRRFGPSSVGA